jgi:acetylornithine deacetylase/succinyl-diaminopimelate desuccinylase-like protein
VPPFAWKIEPDPRIALVYVELQTAIENLTARGRIVEARRLLDAYVEMRRRYERLGISAAAKAEEFMRARLESTEVRPPTSQRLKRAITAAPLETSLPAGAVGMGDIPTLDAATIRTRGRRVYKPYWRAQEHGYAGNIGRIVPGYFHEPGPFTAPTADEFRVHAYFTQVQYQKGEAPPAMVIGKPVPARHFLANGAKDTAIWFRGEAQAIQLRVAQLIEGPRRR